jgi:hypothetical protein
MISRLAAVFLLLPLLSFPLTAAHAQTSVPGQALIDKISPSIVTVRVVIKVQMKAGGQSQSSESKLVTEGVVIAPDGLVMMSNAPISSDVWRQMMGGDPDDKSSLSISPTEFKVIVGREDKEYSAFLAATDPKLGLAFIKIEDLGDRKLPAIDFSNPGVVNVGDQVATVTRLSKGYDYAPVFASGQVKGAITKPRTAYLLSTTIISVGLPVFTLGGDTVGAMILLPTSLDSDASGGNDMMMRFYAGAATDRLGIFLIPASTVQPIIAGAVQQAAKLAADRAKNPPAKPSIPPAPPASTVKPAGK